MRKRQILSIAFIFSFLALSVVFLSHSTLLQAEEADLMPMELEGTEWDVVMTHITAKGKKNISEDKLIFADKKFISERFEKKGYGPTNYSLTLREDGTTRFGTMQIKGKDTSFWKGILEDGTITGSVHIQFSGGESTKTTYFKGTLITGELKRKVEEPTPPPPPPPAPVVQAEEPSKSVMERAKEAVAGAVEKVQELVGSDDSDKVTEEAGSE